MERITASAECCRYYCVLVEITPAGLRGPDAYRAIDCPGGERESIGLRASEHGLDSELARITRRAYAISPVGNQTLDIGTAMRSSRAG